MAAILIIVLIVAFLLIFFISTSNQLERLNIKVEEADSGIDVALAKRYNLLTKSFQMAKGYLKQEQETILQAIHLRQHMPIEDKAQAEQQMNDAARAINVVAEAYPNLGSQALFVELQRSIADSEEHLQAARRLYNANVTKLNQKIVTFPSSIVANAKGMKKIPMFQADAHKKQDVDLAI